MTKTSRKTEFEIEVGGEPFVWRLQRLPQWSSDAKEFRGMALAVRHSEGKREAVLEYPAGKQPKFGAPQLKAEQINPEVVAAGIASAMAVGWEPHSRGKTVTIVVDADGN